MTEHGWTRTACPKPKQKGHSLGPDMLSLIEQGQHVGVLEEIEPFGGPNVNSLNPDVGCTVTAGIAHLMSASRPRRFSGKVYIEVCVELYPAIDSVAIHLQESRTGLRQIGIELVVPGTQERVGYIKSLAIQAQLQHLWATLQFVPLHSITFAQQAAKPELAG